MKAVVYTEYGGPEVLRLEEREKPAPRDGEVLVRVRAASVNFGDLLARNFKAVSPGEFNMPLLFWLITKMSFGWRQPKVRVLGSEFAGEVEALGRGATRFKPGDRVFGFLGQGMGAYAEYVRIPENGGITLLPARTTYEEGAALSYGAVMAVGILRKVSIRPGHKALIIGASGGIGSAAVQIARHFGAEVTGVASGPRLEAVMALGAAKVIDYAREDFSRGGERYNLILDVLGKSSFSRCRSSLTPTGRYLCASFKTGKIIRALLTSLGRGPRAICAIAPGGLKDLLTVAELVEAGQIRAFVDRRFPLRQAAEAHRYVEAGSARGKVVITLD